MLTDIHTGDIGTVLRATIKDGDEVVKLGTATELILYLGKPDGTILTKTDPDVVLTTDGNDGKMEYITISGDIDQSGVWRIHGKVKFAEGSWTSSSVSFTVKEE